MAGSIFNGYVTDFADDTAARPCRAEYKFMDRMTFRLLGARDSVPTGCLIVMDLLGNGQSQLVVATTRGYVAVFDHTSSTPVHVFHDQRLGSILYLTGTRLQGAPVLLALSAEASFHVLGVDGSSNYQLHLKESHRVPTSSVWCVCPVFLDPGATTPHFLLGCMDRSVYLYALTADGLRLETQYQVGAMVYNLVLHQANPGDPPLILVGVQGRYAFIDPKSADCPKSMKIAGPDHATFMFDVLGNVRGRDERADGYYVVSPQNGTIVVCSLSFEGPTHGSLLSRLRTGVLFKVQTGRMLLGGLACHRFMDGQTQLAACTWGGIFFLIDRYGRTVGFNVMKRVRTWASGPFTLNAARETQDCLFYHDFTNQICCCYNVEQYSMPGESLFTGISLARYPRLAVELAPINDMSSSRKSFSSSQLRSDLDVESAGVCVSHLTFDLPSIPVLEADAPGLPLRFLLNARAAGGPVLLRPAAAGIAFDPPYATVPVGQCRSSGFVVSALEGAAPGPVAVTVHPQSGPGNANLLPATPFSLRVEVQRSRLAPAEKRAFLLGLVHCTNAEAYVLQRRHQQLRRRVHLHRSARRLQRWWRGTHKQPPTVLPSPATAYAPRTPSTPRTPSPPRTLEPLTAIS